MDRLNSVLQTLDDLNNSISRCLVKYEKVSNWTVGMQIEHCLLGTRGICNALVNSKPHTGKIKKGLLRRIIFLTGTIPRGRGTAPDTSIPHEETTESGLRELLSESILLVRKAAESESDCWWAHFRFGVMKRDEALKFVAIHNKHHLKLISDIVSKSDVVVKR